MAPGRRPDTFDRVPHHLRPAGDEEFEAFAAVNHAAFGQRLTDAARTRGRHVFEADRSVVAEDGGRIVATAGALSLELTLPGGGAVPASAVSWVGVLPTHRRRGLLTAMMGRLLDDARRRGEPVAALHASEATIYGRFGFGAATHSATYVLPRGALAGSRPEGQLRLLDDAEAADVLPAVYDRYRSGVAGELSRTPGWWAANLEDREPEGDGARYRVAAAPAGGEVDGYVEYRTAPAWSDGAEPQTALEVTQLCASTPRAERDLLTYLAGVDLVRRTKITRPAGDGFAGMLADPRQAAVSGIADRLWVRPVDVAAALSARSYRVEASVVLTVDDPACPWNTGTWLLEGGPDGAACRSGRGEGLRVTPAAVGCLLLGGVAPSALSRAGLLREERSGALQRAAAMFGIDPPPWCQTDF